MTNKTTDDAPNKTADDTTNRNAPPLPTEIVLSGGGTNTLAIIGALHTLHEHERLGAVVRWVGASAGALVCLFMVIGYSPHALFRLLLHIDYSKLNEVNCDSVLSFYDTMGVIDGDRIMRILELALAKKGYDRAVTFRQLVDTTQHELIVTGYNLTRGKTEAFDAQRTPDMSVLLACRISMSVPFLFRPVVHNGHMYIDGCTLEHVPVRYSKHHTRTLVIECVKHKNRTASQALPQDVPSFFALLNQRVGTVLYKKCMHRIQKKQPHAILTVCIPETTNMSFVVDFDISCEQKKSLFEVGQSSATRYVETVDRPAQENESPSS